LQNGNPTPKRRLFQETAAHNSKHQIKVENKKSARVYLEYTEINQSEGTKGADTT